MVATCLAQHPFTDRHDEAGFFGERDEVRRRDQPQIRVLPAQKGFQRDQATLVGAHQRLEMQQ